MIGKYPAKMDEKNRLFVPAKLRGELGGTFYVTIGVNGGHRCLTVYTEDGWQRLIDKYDQLPIAMKSGARALRSLVQTKVESPLAGFLLGCDQQPAVVRGALMGEELIFS